MKEKIIVVAKFLDNITCKLNGLSSIFIGIITIFILAMSIVLWNTFHLEVASF